jgi:hypothetical protein
MFNKNISWQAMAVGAGIILITSFRTLHADDPGPGGLPYPNDTGNAQIDVLSYPPEIQADYKIFARRCSQCHSLSRPLNSQFVQLTAEEQKASQAKEPEIFKDAKIWKISESVWTDYVKLMQSKPGAIIRGSEFDKIVAFLVYDSKIRKTGAAKEAWRTSRQKLLDDFKKSNPKRYAELFGK